jgi:hypothetical protein
MVDAIKQKRLTFGPISAKPKEMDDQAELQTLNSGQISKIADVVGAMGEEILKFKKEFESRDRYYNTMLKGLDQISKEMEGAITQAQESADNAQQPAPAAAPEATPAATPEAGAQPAAAPATTEQPAAAATQSAAPAPAPAPAEPAGDADGQKKIEQNAAIDKYARKFVSTWSGMFRKEISLSGSLLTHAMKVGQVFLTYGERSVAQYGS